MALSLPFCWCYFFQVTSVQNFTTSDTMNHTRCFCQRRAFHAFRQLAEQGQTGSKADLPKANASKVGSQVAQSRAPSPKDWLPRKGEDFKPQPLGRPIGFNRPP